jgi:AcrR family transcriptional regulator
MGSRRPFTNYSIDADNPRQRRPLGDGRRERSAQTRQLIIEAYLDLLRVSPRIPTASEIAAKAGCSRRSVFERFQDLLT